MLTRLVAAPVAALLLLAGCTSERRPAVDRDPAPSAAGTAAAARGLVKEGWFGVGSLLHARVEMLRVERYPDRSVLRFAVTNLDPEPALVLNAFGVAIGDYLAYRIPLIDTVGRKQYLPLEDESRSTIGSRPGRYLPGVRYETEVHYPPLPEGLTTVTALTAGTTGEFAGIPVTAPAGAPSAPVDEGGGSTPSSGATLSWPVRTADRPRSTVDDLYDIVESRVKETVSGGGEEKIGLRTDVLFAFDSAKLSPRATAVLDEVAAETRRKADPAKPPIRLVGHTDSKGADAYNRRLSRERAATVRAELERRLGPGYRYEVSGLGESRPIAKEGGPNDAKARARNRRVEISYQIKQAAPGSVETSGASTSASPAPFRAEDGPVVASRTATSLQRDRKLRIDVRPAYRDGAYLVVVFDIVNLGPGKQLALTDYGDLDYPGGMFTSFSVVDPATGVRYRAVRAGPEGDGLRDYVDAGWATFRTGEGEANRGFFYAPAPPAGVTSVTLDAGLFGEVTGVPIG